MDTVSVADQIASILKLSKEKASFLVIEAERLYAGRMTQRFSELKVAERLKRTNPFLLRIRGIKSVREWAEMQVQSALIASEEEAVGHLLEAIAKIAHPTAQKPKYGDDFDLEVADDKKVRSYQIKMSWDCMPMSSRKNLSATIRKVREIYKSEGKEFEGVFASCYGRTKSSKPPGQEYVSLRSREFWTEVGDGDEDYDVRVGDACALLCAVFRQDLAANLIPTLVTNLAEAAKALIGDESGDIDHEKLFRRINK